MAESKIDTSKAKPCSNRDWVEQHPAVAEWLEGYRKSYHVSASIVRGWHDWMAVNGGTVRGMSPEQLIEFQRKAKRDDGYDEFIILDRTIKYIQSQGNWTPLYQKKVLSTVRSFFAAHRKAELPEDKKAVKKLQSEVMPSPQDLKLAEFKRVVEASNELHRAVFLCMFLSGMGQDEIIEWSNQGITRLREQLREDPDEIKIKLRPRKHNPQSYYTFVGGDALYALNNWLKKRAQLQKEFNEKHPNKEFPNTVFVTNKHTPITYGGINSYWDRKIKRLGILREKMPKSGKRRGFNPHQIRSLFRSQWTKSASEKGEVAEFMMGHRIDPLNYNRFFNDEDWVRQEFRKALPFLNIVSSDRPFRKIDENELESLREENKKLSQELEETQKGVLEMRREFGKLLILRMLDQTSDREEREKLLGQLKEIESTQDIRHFTIPTDDLYRGDKLKGELAKTQKQS